MTAASLLHGSATGPQETYEAVPNRDGHLGASLGIDYPSPMSTRVRARVKQPAHRYETQSHNEAMVAGGCGFGRD